MVNSAYGGDERVAKNQLRITFLAIIILMDEFIVTAGDDGYVRHLTSISNLISIDLHLEGLRYCQERACTFQHPCCVSVHFRIRPM